MIRKLIAWWSTYVKWHYLGWAEFYWCGATTDEKRQRFTCHFYGRGQRFDQRKVKIHGSLGFYEEHPFYQQNIIPWQHGENLFTTILKPSKFLQDWASSNGGWEWDQHRTWSRTTPKKVPPKVDNNVIEFTKKTT